MEHALLILTLATASIGFIIWYWLSSSLRLPVRYQIMYDANPPYVNRVFRRRVLGIFIYGLIPFYIIRHTNWIKKPTLADLNISFHIDQEVAIYTLAGVALVFLISILTTPTHASLEQYPEVRVRFWRPNILFFSALWWIFYIAAFEFFYRGLLFQSFRLALDNDVLAIAATTSLYCLLHYFKLNRVTIASFFYSVLACWVVLKTGSLIPVIATHIALTLSIEWLSILHHREMYVRRT
jgi:hypothetical protein